ncbi:MAG: DUF3341 domain-containing protein [Phycisphaeraceae bacterium]|nr:DUF3341 domain-containing protein [Phycisphaeraceae bacterium]
MQDAASHPTPHGQATAATEQASAAPFAMLAEFADVTSVVNAARKTREQGYVHFDVHSPLPIHGIDRAVGIRPTILPWLTLAGGLAGFFGGLFLVWWMNATMFSGVTTSLQGYPYLISGKPIFSLQANIPIIFETTILLAAFATVFGMFALNRLPMLYHPLFKSSRFSRVTSDRFFLVIEADDPKYDSRWTREFLEKLDPLSIEEVDD